jgi:hypothetical protein
VFNHLPANVNLSDKNMDQNKLADLSEKFDWSKEDKVPDLVFNDILWKSIKGLDAITPAPKRAAFIKTTNKKKDADD